MARLKKNAMGQVLFAMVDKADFATIESTITESDFNSKILNGSAVTKVFGVNHGLSTAFASVAISKAIRLVRSGLWNLTLKAAETNYDHLMIRVTHPSCADQLLVFETVDNDDSDVHSLLSDIRSMASNAASAAVQANSRVLLVQSDASQIVSYLIGMSDGQSNIYSLLSDMTSDLRSFLVVMSGVISDVRSGVSDMHSDLLSLLNGTGVALNSDTLSNIRSAITAGPAGAVTASDISDIALAVDNRLASRISDILREAMQGNSRTELVRTALSNVASDLSDVRSDLRSLLLTGVSLTVSAMSNVASQVWAHAVGVRVDSRILVNVNAISSLTSEFNSRISGTVATASDVASKVWAEKYTAAGNKLVSSFGSLMVNPVSLISSIGTTVYNRVQSDLSDLLSRTTQINSRALRGMSDTSQIVSQIATIGNGVPLDSATLSDLRSAIAAGPAATVTASDISEIVSAMRLNLASDLSDILSHALQGNSRAAIIQTMLSNVQSALSDVHSDLRSQIGGITATINASDISEIASAVKIAIGSELSDILSHALQGNSRAAVIQTMLSNVQSAVSDLHSDLTSQLGNVGVTASSISEIASAVQLILSDTLSNIMSAAVQAGSRAAQGSSRALVNQSSISDVHSMLSDFYSDFVSRVTAGIATRSQLSDLHSDLRSVALGNSAVLSDVYSQLVGISAVLSDVDSAVTNAVGIKRNTALPNFEFLMLDNTDHITPKTGLTVSAFRSLDGAAFGSAANAVTELSNGIYKINLAASDLNGTIVCLRFTAASADDRIIIIKTQP